MPLADTQFLLNATFTFGNGTAFDVASVDGLFGFATSPHDTSPSGDGTIAARDSKAPRQVLFGIEIVGAANLSTWAAAWVNGNADVKLQYKIPTIAHERYVWGRPRRWATPWSQQSDRGFFVVVAEFFCPSPTIYDATTNTAVAF